jgi:tetratricopeptide (TPR) repeat protein
VENRAKAEDEIKRPSSTRLLRKPFYAYWTIRKTFKNELWPGSTRCPARSAISRVQIPVEKQPWQLRTKVGTFCNLLERRCTSLLLVQFLAPLLLLAVLILALGNGIVSYAAAETAATSGAGNSPTTGDPDAYLAQLRTVLPQSWLQREFQRQRSFPAFARSRQLVAKGQDQEAFQELEQYLASDPDDLVIQFGYLVLASDLKRYRAAIGAADQILAAVPEFAPALFYRGLARAALGENKEALPDLAAAVDSNALAPADRQYARRSLAVVAVASPVPADALALLDREEAKAGADGTLLVAKGQLLERLGRKAEAKAAYDDAVKRAKNNDEKRAAWVFGAELALKNSDPTEALPRAEAAWKLAPGNPEAATVLAEAASRLGRTDLVERAEREAKASSSDRGIRESLANALFRVGRYDQAATNFAELAETAASPPEEYRLRRAAGFAAQAAQDSARAFSELQRAAAINPAPEALSAAAEASLQAGHLDVAAADLAQLADASDGKDRGHALQRLSAVEEQRGRFQEALTALDRIPTDQRNASLERRSAILAAKIGDLEAAVRYAQRVADLEPTRADLRALGEAELAAGHPDAAIESFQRALSLQPENDSGLREMLANSLTAVGRASVAAAEFERLAAAATLPADKHRLELAAGFAALNAGDTMRALAAFRQAVAIEANRKSLEAAAETALQAGQLAEAAGYLERLVAAADDDIDRRVRHLERLSFVYEMMGQTRQAVEALARLPMTAQNRPEIIRREAVLAQKLGDRRAMLAHLRELAAAEPSETNLAALADAEIGAGQSNAAATTLETLLANRNLPAQRRASYLERLGNIEISRGNTKRAQSLFLEAYHTSPAHPPEWLAQAAESAMQAKDWQQAAQWYRLLAENQRITRKTRAGYDTRLGVALASLGRDQEAVAAYDAAIQLGGATPSLHENRGIVLMRLARAAAALSDLRAAYDAVPRADLAASLGYAYQAVHQPGPAIVFLRRALADPQALSSAQRQQTSAALGYAYSDTEQHDKAASCFERALGILPSATSSRGCGVNNETAAIQ